MDSIPSSSLLCVDEIELQLSPCSLEGNSKQDQQSTASKSPIIHPAACPQSYLSVTERLHGLCCAEQRFGMPQVTATSSSIEQRQPQPQANKRKHVSRTEEVEEEREGSLETLGSFPTSPVTCASTPVESVRESKLPLPSTSFLLSPSVRQTERQSLIGYLYDLARNMQLDEKTADLAVRYYDIFTSSIEFPVKAIYRPVLVQSCLMVAIKFNEVTIPHWTEFQPSDSEFGRREDQNVYLHYVRNLNPKILAQMEMAILRQLEWKMNMATSVSVARLLMEQTNTNVSSSFGAKKTYHMIAKLNQEHPEYIGAGRCVVGAAAFLSVHKSFSLLGEDELNEIVKMITDAGMEMAQVNRLESEFSQLFGKNHSSASLRAAGDQAATVAVTSASAKRRRVMGQGPMVVQ